MQVPVVGNSGGEIFYAGLADGFVDTGERNLVESPYLPLYSLHRLQPLSVRYGVGPIQQVTASDTGGPTDVVQALDRYLAAQIAYGHCGRLVPTTWGERMQMRSYFMMQKTPVSHCWAHRGTCCLLGRRTICDGLTGTRLGQYGRTQSCTRTMPVG